MPQPIVLVDISISVDGFIARPSDESGPIHEWFFGGKTLDADQAGDVPSAFAPSGASRQVLEENLSRPGAVITGRRTYDFTGGWSGNHPTGVPVFVVTHQAPDAADVPVGPTQFTFVSDVSEAVESARAAAAGSEEVHIMGGSSIIAQALDLGLVDELQVHVAPVLLGAGVRLIDALAGGREIRLEQTRVIEAPDVTHLRYRVETR